MTHPNGRRQVLVSRRQQAFVHVTHIPPPLTRMIAQREDAKPQWSPPTVAQCETARPRDQLPGMCYCGLLWLVWE